MKNFENIRLLKFNGLFYRFNYHALTHFQQCLGRTSKRELNALTALTPSPFSPTLFLNALL
ncbi:hypothetical protein NE540_24150, partial [Phocaeicola vulgatus]|uniref:hypothetical protein n=1 Tax=Phocaeicola vulgatus TaxID=821 RepID=UPI00210AB069